MAIALIVHFVLVQDHKVSISVAKFGHVISNICKSKLGQTPGSIWALRSRPAMRLPNVLMKVKRHKFGPGISGLSKSKLYQA